VVELHVPALRERRDDILPLARVLLAGAALWMNRKISGFAPGVAEQLKIGAATLYRKLKSYGTIASGRGAEGVPATQD
jgi:DNA-binding NtrC family response regulator